MDLSRRAVLRVAGVAGLAGLAGCAGGDDDGDGGEGGSRQGGSPSGSPTNASEPSPTPACGDSNYIDDGEFSFEYGVVTHNDPDNYEGTLRIYHIETPVCNFPEADPTPAFPGETASPTVAAGECPGASEELLAERDYRVTGDLVYDIVDAPVTRHVDTYRLEWEAAGGKDIKRGVEEGARAFVDTQLKYEFFVCNPGARRFGFVVADGKPRIARSPTAN
jgi:hypothetical protein